MSNTRVRLELWEAECIDRYLALDNDAPPEAYDAAIEELAMVQTLLMVLPV